LAYEETEGFLFASFVVRYRPRVVRYYFCGYVRYQTFVFYDSEVVFVCVLGWIYARSYYGFDDLPPAISVDLAVRYQAYRVRDFLCVDVEGFDVRTSSAFACYAENFARDGIGGLARGGGGAAAHGRDFFEQFGYGFVGRDDGRCARGESPVLGVPAPLVFRELG
jgi:hypothetical protein